VNVDDQPFEEAMGSSEAMEVDTTEPELNQVDQDEDVEEESEANDEDEADPSDVAMVPLADVLNARYQTENVRVDDHNIIVLASFPPISLRIGQALLRARRTPDDLYSRYICRGTDCQSSF